MQFVTFSDAGTHGSGLLDGGVWDLTIDDAKVSDGTTTMAADVTGAFFSMFGTVDANNSYAIPGGATSNAFVDPGSLFQFNDAFGSYFNNPYYPTPVYNPTFDVNLDGYVDVWDLFNFSDWFGTDWSWTAASASAPTLVAFTAKTYDAAGRVTEHVSAERNGVELDYHGYEYDFANRVTRDQHNGDIKTYAYDNASQLTSETNGSGTTTYAYDANGNREEVDSSNNDDDRDYTTGDDNQYETDGVWDYTYSPNGNLTGRVSKDTDETWEYTYDHRNQLVRVDRLMNGIDVDQRVDFTYDAWGNRVSRTVDLDGPSGSPYVAPAETTQYPSYVIGKSSEYTATDWSAMQATGAPDVFFHGDNANAWAALDPDNAEYLSLGLTTPMYVQDVTIRESYNVGFVTKVELIKMDNSRVQIWAGTDPSTGTSIVNFKVYVRDGNGDPIETDYLVKGIKIYIDGTHVLEDWEEIDSVAIHGTLPEIEAYNLEPVTTQFTIDGWNPAKGPPIGLENFDVWSDHDDSSLTTRYLWGDGVKQLLGRTEIVGETSTQLWYLTDKLGSINTVISATGEVLDKIDYDAFGNIISESHPENRGRFAWTAQEREDLIDGQYNGRRVYFFFIGAWSSKDPGGFGMGDANLVRYVGNSPTNWTDPSGLAPPGRGDYLVPPPRENYPGMHNHENWRLLPTEGYYEEMIAGSSAIATFSGWMSFLPRVGFLWRIAATGFEDDAERYRARLRDLRGEAHPDLNNIDPIDLINRLPPPGLVMCNPNGPRPGGGGGGGGGGGQRPGGGGQGAPPPRPPAGAPDPRRQVPPRLSDQEALRLALAARNARVAAAELRGARPHGPEGRPGHPLAHGMPYSEHANNINNAQRRFVGINDNGRPVLIFYRNGNVTITESGDPTRIITGYRAGNPSRWVNNPSYHEIVN